MIVDMRTLSSCLLAFFPLLLSNVAMVAGSIFQLSTTKEGVEFLERNSKKDGIIEDPINGLQHKVLRAGTGVEHPTINSEVVVDYEGRTLSGAVFKSSFESDEASLFSVSDTSLIRGFAYVLHSMVEGDRWEVFIPAELSYGSKGDLALHIEPGEVIIYVIELVEIIGFTEKAYYCTVNAPETTSWRGTYGSTGCNKQEELYILEAASWNLEDLHSEQMLLVKAEPARGSTHMERESKHWIHRRFHILKQLRKILNAKAEL